MNELFESLKMIKLNEVRILIINHVYQFTDNLSLFNVNLIIIYYILSILLILLFTIINWN